MTRFSATHAAVSLSALLLAVTLSAQSSDTPSESTGISKVRIVRLSQVKGAVQMDRGIDRGLEPAITNLPIVEKSSLQTGVGVAEVEFEDNSTLRIGPNSIVEFPRLERLPGGTTVSSVHLLKGTAYVSLIKSPGNEFNLLFGQENLRLASASHIRLEMAGEDAKLAVFDGTVHIEGPAGVMDVPKKKTVTFNLLQTSEPAVDREIASNALDTWDHNEAQYHERMSFTSSLNSSPYTYGLNDMMYYGSFMDAGGCGTMWRPYFASAAWDPYSNGAWAWYQGAGYSWVSPYPWGWMPYHYGSWSFCPGAGWGWMPGGGWMGLNNMAAVANPNQPRHFPVSPIHPPRKGESTLLAVNSKPLVASQVASPKSFVFRSDSAGLGIPREELGKLNKFSERTLEKGTATAEIHFEASRGTGEHGGSVTMTSMHRGSAAPPSQGGYAQSGGAGRTSSSSTATSSASTTSGGHSASAGGAHH